MWPVFWTASTLRAQLRRDRIDLVFLHLNALPIDEAASVLEAFQRRKRGGGSDHLVGQLTSPDRAAAWVGEVGYTAVQHSLNVFFNAPSLMAAIESQGLCPVNRSPLAMGILSGKDYANQDFSKDIRANSLDWLDYFKDGKITASFQKRLNAVRDLLTSNGRTLNSGRRHSMELGPFTQHCANPRRARPNRPFRTPKP